MLTAHPQSRGRGKGRKLRHAMACKVKIVPVRVHWYHDDLRANASRVVGYRAVCADHFRGPVRRSVQQAREDWRKHRASMTAHSDDSPGAG